MHYLPSNIPDEAILALRPAAQCSDVSKAEEWVHQCKQDLAQLWREGEFWLVTQVVHLRDGVALKIVAAAGEYAQSLVQEAEEWGRSIGCKKVFFTGRRGWEKVAPGYRLRAVIMEKEL